MNELQKMWNKTLVETSDTLVGKSESKKSLGENEISKYKPGFTLGTKTDEGKIQFSKSISFDETNQVYVMDTPDILLEVGMKKKPIIITVKHIRNITRPQSKKIIIME